MSTGPLISVVIPVYNAGADLDPLLASLLAQDYSNYEIVVVDNNSTDGSAEKAAAWAKREATVRCVREPEQGVTMARNRGWREAQGDLIAYVDQDELAPPGWLSALRRAQEESGAGGVGGPYEPLWAAPPPRWLARSVCFREVITFFDFGSQPRLMDWLLGGNCCYTRPAIEAARGFGDWQSYTSKRSLVGGEDILMGQRVRQAGFVLWYEPRAVVKHRVPRPRQRLSYVLRRAFWAGYTEVAVGGDFQVARKAGRAIRRGPDALLLGMVILPGVLYGRLMKRLGVLRPPTPPETTEKCPETLLRLPSQQYADFLKQA